MLRASELLYIKSNTSELLQPFRSTYRRTYRFDQAIITAELQARPPLECNARFSGFATTKVALVPVQHCGRKIGMLIYTSQGVSDTLVGPFPVPTPSEVAITPTAWPQSCRIALAIAVLNWLNSRVSPLNKLKSDVSMSETV